MVDSIFRSLRYRTRRRSNSMRKQVCETNSVNMAIENELALLNKPQKKPNPTAKAPLAIIDCLPSKDDHEPARKPLNPANKQKSFARGVIEKGL
ncbi:unnamed protein product [Nippostrongylus brasiliensis]|uniref:Uncharacterized protein n=1 Tax=Nippostrongylus brasiliensis TaxID=27835 RepID=A0A0N4YBX3_NIPBR|nr:hypothetical protein Q1695_007523 [Nippostrongylus brasiliensis]VDL77595.1 unnamed protein product [Nippostrongylus brasiliensis]